MRKRRKIKNIILKTIYTIIGFICAYAACCLDAGTPFVIVFAVTFGFLMLAAYANGGFN